jgi:hypothetical protein
LYPGRPSVHRNITPRESVIDESGTTEIAVSTLHGPADWRKSPSAFANHLYNLLCGRRPPPLHELLEWHSYHQELRSGRSYILLLAYAYRLSDFKTARRIINLMENERYGSSPSASAKTQSNSTYSEPEYREVVAKSLWQNGGIGGKERAASSPLDGAIADDERPSSPAERLIWSESVINRVHQDLQLDSLPALLDAAFIRSALAARIDHTNLQREHNLARERLLQGLQGYEEARHFTQSFPPAVSRAKLSKIPMSTLPNETARLLVRRSDDILTIDLFLAYMGYVLRSTRSIVSSPKHEAASSSVPLQTLLESSNRIDNHLDVRTQSKEQHSAMELAVAGPPIAGPSVEDALETLRSFSQGRSTECAKISHSHFIRLLHLYLQPHLSARFPPGRTIKKFQLAASEFELPFQPNMRTLTLALKALKPRRTRHISAMYLVRKFRRVWGEELVGVLSWRLLAQYGIEMRSPITIRTAKKGMRRFLRRWRVSRRNIYNQALNNAPNDRRSGRMEAGDTAGAPRNSAARIRWRTSLIERNLVTWRMMKRRVKRRLYSSSRPLPNRRRDHVIRSDS